MQSSGNNISKLAPGEVIEHGSSTTSEVGKAESTRIRVPSACNRLHNLGSSDCARQTVCNSQLLTGLSREPLARGQSLDAKLAYLGVRAIVVISRLVRRTWCNGCRTAPCHVCCYLAQWSLLCFLRTDCCSRASTGDHRGPVPRGEQTKEVGRPVLRLVWDKVSRLLRMKECLLNYCRRASQPGIPAFKPPTDQLPSSQSARLPKDALKNPGWGAGAEAQMERQRALERRKALMQYGQK
jgi:hypothetical protein